MPTSFLADNLGAALSCAAAGARVFPAKAIYNRAVQRWNKPPAIIDWRSNATTDSRTIEEWWQRHPDAIPAICCDEVVVVDADRHHCGGDGVAALYALAVLNGGLSDHPVVLTPGDGEHHYFAQPNPPLGNRTGNLPLNIDIRGVGGFVIAPGAVLHGKRWRMVRNFCPDLPPLPQWLEGLIRADRDDVVDQGRYVGETPDGPVNAVTDRERRYAAAALAACCDEVMAAPVGQRNITLNNVAYRMGRMTARGWTDRPEVEACLHRSAFRLEREDGRASVMGTIKSGIDAGYRNPHLDLVDRNGGGR